MMDHGANTMTKKGVGYNAGLYLRSESQTNNLIFIAVLYTCLISERWVSWSKEKEKRLQNKGREAGKPVNET